MADSKHGVPRTLPRETLVAKMLSRCLLETHCRPNSKHKNSPHLPLSMYCDRYTSSSSSCAAIYHTAIHAWIIFLSRYTHKGHLDRRSFPMAHVTTGFSLFGSPLPVAACPQVVPLKLPRKAACVATHIAASQRKCYDSRLATLIMSGA